MATNVGLPQLALDLVLGGEAYIGMAQSLSVPIMFPVVRKSRAPSFTFACGRDFSHGIKLSCATFTLAVTSGVIGRTTALMAWLMNNGYNFRVDIPLVVSVVEISLLV